MKIVHNTCTSLKHATYLFPIQMTGNASDKVELHDISRYTKRNSNASHDVIFDVLKPNDAEEIACPLNIW